MIQTSSDSHNLEKLCQHLTNISAGDVAFISKIVPRLQMLADKWQQDVFIDCLSKSGSDAVVVAQATPENSNYQHSIVGFYIHEDAEPAVFRTFRSGVKTKNVKAVSYTKKAGHLIIQNVLPINRNGKTIAVLIFENSLSAHQPRIKSKMTPCFSPVETFGLMVQNFEDAVVLLNSNKKIVFLNNSADRLFRDFGYVDDLLYQKYDEVAIYGKLAVASSGDSVYQVTRLILGQYYRIKEYVLKNADGLYYQIVIRNITSEKHNERETELRLDLMREVHHRIKNNLQTIYSLLDLQRRRTKQQETNLILQDAMGRLLSISTTYETLLKGYGKTVNIRDVIRALRDNLVQLVKTPAKDIDVEILGDDIMVDWNLSISIAMVVNELLQNSFKFAFRDRDTGKIIISINKIPIYSEISVCDDGVGFDPESQKRNLGLQIVENIVRSNLKGKLNIRSGGGGTEVIFSFRSHSELKYTT